MNHRWPPPPNPSLPSLPAFLPLHVCITGLCECSVSIERSGFAVYKGGKVRERVKTPGASNPILCPLVSHNHSQS